MEISNIQNNFRSESLKFDFDVLKFLGIIFIFANFLDSFTIRSNSLPFDLRPEIIVSIFILLLFPLFLINLGLKIKFNAFILIFCCIILEVFVVVIKHKSFPVPFIKQIFAIFLIFTSSYMIIRKLGIVKTFDIYIRISIFMAFFNIVQSIAFIVGFKFFYDLQYILPNWGLHVSHNFYRAHAFFSEPSHFALALAPAFFVALCSIFDRRNRYIPIHSSLILITGYILTFSGIAFLAITISFLVFFLDNFKRKNIVKLFLLFSLLVFILMRVPPIQDRIQQSLIFAWGQGIERVTNISVLTLFNNLYISFHCFKDNPIFGYGLGMYEKVYDKYSPDLIFMVTGLNKKDANSLLLRILAELGCFGILLLSLFVLSNFRPKRSFNNLIFYLINRSSFVYLFLKLIRSGNYVNLGFPIFIILIYFSAHRRFVK